MTTKTGDKKIINATDNLVYENKIFSKYNKKIVKYNRNFYLELKANTVWDKEKKKRIGVETFKKNCFTPSPKKVEEIKK